VSHHLGHGQARTTKTATGIFTSGWTVFMLGYGIFGPHLLSKIVNDNHGQGEMGVKEQIPKDQNHNGPRGNKVVVQIANAKKEHYVNYPIDNLNVN
jgi:hypothetical protein